MMAHVVVFTLLFTCPLRVNRMLSFSLVKINLMLSEIEAAASCPVLVELDLRM